MKPSLRWRNASYLARIDLIPPPLCYLLARKDRRPIEIVEISKRCGISERELCRIFSLDSWATIPVAQMDAIRAACGITPANERRHLEYMKLTLMGNNALVHNQKRNNAARLKLARVITSEAFQRKWTARYECLGIGRGNQPHTDGMLTRPRHAGAESQTPSSDEGESQPDSPSPEKVS